MNRPFGFSKKDKLRRRKEFLDVGAEKQQFFGKYIIIHWKKTGVAYARLGITVSKKYGNAVERNQFKRMVREAFRLSKKKIEMGVDINVHPRKHAKGLTLSALFLDFDTFISFLRQKSR